MKKIILENDLIKATFIPRLGMKLSSLIYKPKNKEVFFQPAKGGYGEPKLADPFENYDTSGCDDMLPTIDACYSLTDHGEIWCNDVTDYMEENNKIEFNVNLRTMPLKLNKELYLDDNMLVMNYKIENLTHERLSYIWALHPLNVFDDNTKMLIECNDNILNVKDSEILGGVEENVTFPILNKNDIEIDLSKLSSYNDGKFYKFYFKDKVNLNKAGLRYGNEGVDFMIHYDKDFSPYLGVWINKGGFKDEYNVAIEPSTAFYDSIDIAERWNRESFIEPKEIKEFTLKMELKSFQ